MELQHLLLFPPSSRGRCSRSGLVVLWGLVAQSGERPPCKRRVAGSIPRLGLHSLSTSSVVSLGWMTPEYTAGFLDGEGHITILNRNRASGYSSYGIHVGFTNRSLSVLLALQKAWGGTIFQKKRHSSRHSQTYELRIGKRAEVGRLLESVLPHLLIKQKQAELGLEFLKLGRVRMVLKTNRGKAWPIFAGSDEDARTRAEFKQNLSELNKRGPCLPSQSPSVN